MTTKATIVGLAAAGCVVAAGVGGFVAVRLNSGEKATPAVIGSTAPEARARETSQPSPVLSPDKDKSAASARTSPAPRADRTSDPAAAERPSAQLPAAPASLESGNTPSTPVPVISDPPVAAQAPPPPPATDVAPPVVDLPKPKYDELTVKEESVIGIRLESLITTEKAKVEDKVVARVLRDVTVGGRTAIPAGARVEGTVTTVEHGSKFKNRARLVIRFTSLVLSDDTRVAIQTDPISRDADSPANEATAKIGASAVVGAILGGLAGGKKGAAIGGAAGAGAGTAMVAAGGTNEVVLPAGMSMTVKLTAPIVVLIERDQF